MKINLTSDEILSLLLDKSIHKENVSISCNPISITTLISLMHEEVTKELKKGHTRTQAPMHDQFATA